MSIMHTAFLLRVSLCFLFLAVSFGFGSTKTSDSTTEESEALTDDDKVADYDSTLSELL